MSLTTNLVSLYHLIIKDTKEISFEMFTKKCKKAYKRELKVIGHIKYPDYIWEMLKRMRFANSLRPVMPEVDSPEDVARG